MPCADNATRARRKASCSCRAAHLSCNDNRNDCKSAIEGASFVREDDDGLADCAARAAGACRCLQSASARAPQAQGYPSQNLTIVVSLGAGTGMDVLVRLYAEKLSAALGQGRWWSRTSPAPRPCWRPRRSRPSPPDGHTLVVLTSCALAINQALYKQINYSPENDFTPISLYVKSPLILVVNPNLPAKTVPEFIAHAKQANPPLNYASVGAGAFQHISMEFAKQRFGFDANHVPYRNTGQSVTDLVAGHVADRLRRGRRVDPGDQGRQAARARGVVRDPPAAAARGAAVLGSGRRAGFRGGVLARPAGALEDAEGDRRPAARRDEEDHERSGDEEAGRRHRPDPVRHAVGRRHQRLHQVGAREVGRAGREDRVAGARSRPVRRIRCPDDCRTRWRWSTGAGCVGPGWGNGRATAVRFAQEGAKVFAVDKNAEAMKETLERARRVRRRRSSRTTAM